MVKEKKMRRAINKKYAFGVYKPNKNCKPVTYNGTEYLSKAQCMALEGITRKELDEYLNRNLGEINEAINVQEGHPVEELEAAVGGPFGFNPKEIPEGANLYDIL